VSRPGPYGSGPAGPPSRAEAVRRLTAPGAPFELVEREVGGRAVRVFRHAPGSLRALYEQTLSDAEFIVFEQERITFRESWRRARAVAAGLAQRCGVRPGDRVAIAMRNYPEWMIAFQAITALGAIAVALNAHWTGEELAYGLRDCDAKVLLADGERLRRLEAVARPAGLQIVACRASSAPVSEALAWEVLAADPAPPEPAAQLAADDDALILYTSGSTGPPKGVVSTHRAVLTALLSWELDAQVAMARGGPPPPDGQPVALLAVPLFHVTGLHAVFLSAFRAGRRVVAMYKWDPDRAADLIEREGVTQINAPAAVTGDLLAYARRSGRNLPSLRLVGGGGASRAPEQVRAIPEVFPGALPLTGWGMTETNAIGAGVRGRDYLEHPGSAGQAAAVLDLRVVGEGGESLPPGEAGELQVRGASLMRGYWRRPDANAEVFDGPWLRTGDIAKIDAEGYVWIVDRLKDLIIRGGENIGCGVVEAALLEHPLVEEAAVFGLPDPRLGEAVGACVRAREALAPEDLRAFLEGRLARFEIPSRIWIQSAPLPRTPSGKILKRQIRSRILESGEGPLDQPIG
jgi:long-chain acyl-CoA synthetase